MLVERWKKKKKLWLRITSLYVGLLCVGDGVCVGRRVVSRNQRINVQRKYMKPCTPWDWEWESCYLFSCWFKNRWHSDRESTWQFRRHGFDPWVRKIPLSTTWQPTPVVFAWKISWTEEPGWLLSTGLQSQAWLSTHVRTHNTWQTKLFLYKKELSFTLWWIHGLSCQLQPSSCLEPFPAQLFLSGQRCLKPGFFLSQQPNSCYFSFFFFFFRVHSCNPVKTWTTYQNRCFSKEDMANGCKKDVQHHYSSGKCTSEPQDITTDLFEWLVTQKDKN